LFAGLREKGNASSPELVHRDVELVYGDHQISEKAVNHLL
jgi:hypothetical protein